MKKLTLFVFVTLLHSSLFAATPASLYSYLTRWMQADSSYLRTFSDSPNAVAYFTGELQVHLSVQELINSGQDLDTIRSEMMQARGINQSYQQLYGSLNVGVWSYFQGIVDGETEVIWAIDNT